MRIVDAHPGEIVTVTVIVLDQNNEGSTVQALAPGVGKSGQWSVQDNVEVVSTGHVLPAPMLEAIKAISDAKKVKNGG